MTLPKRRFPALGLLAVAGLWTFAPMPCASSANAQDAAADNSAAAPTGSVSGMGDINLYPKRVVISGRQRVATIGLYNKSAAAGDYDIQLNDLMMTREGRLVELGSATDAAARDRVKTASALLRWSPRKVALRGNEAQTVRVMARIPPDLPPGEYRSHFAAVAIPPGGVGGFSIEEAAGGSGGRSIGVRIIPRFGISIPVILRVGETTLSTGLRDLSVIAGPTGAKAVALTITRSGTRSAFGDITVTAPGAKKPIALIKGIGIYTEIDERRVHIPIDPQADPRLYARDAKLTVTYVDDDFAPGETLARQEFAVP